MCGIWGFVATGNRGPCLNRLSNIIDATESRGRHAFGFSWIGFDGRIRAFKQTGKLSDKFALLRLLADARMVIGHCRFATHGDPANNLNNHPFPVDGGWLVHNGVVSNHEAIRQAIDVPAITDCDSEVLANIIEVAEGTHVERCCVAVSETIPTAPLAFMALWARPARLIVVRRGNPVHVSLGERGHYLGSTIGGLPVNHRKAILDGEGIEFGISDRGTYVRNFRVSDFNYREMMTPACGQSRDRQPARPDRSRK